MYYLGSFTGVILEVWLCEASGSLAGNYVTASVWCTEANPSDSERPSACRKFAGKASETELCSAPEGERELGGSRFSRDLCVD